MLNDPEPNEVNYYYLSSESQFNSSDWMSKLFSNGCTHVRPSPNWRWDDMVFWYDINNYYSNLSFFLQSIWLEYLSRLDHPKFGVWNDAEHSLSLLEKNNFIFFALLQFPVWLQLHLYEVCDCMLANKAQKAQYQTKSFYTKCIAKRK